MNMRPTFPDHIAEITKSASVKLTFGQPAYLLPTYSNHPLKQVQVSLVFWCFLECSRMTQQRFSAKLLFDNNQDNGFVKFKIDL